MIECPRCEAQIKGHYCRCGYQVPQWSERVDQIKRSEQVQEHRERWAQLRTKFFPELKRSRASRK